MQRDARHVVDIRSIGMLAGIDLAPRAGAPGARASACAAACFANDVLIRSSGDTLLLSPPLVIEPEQIARVFLTLRDALDAMID